MVKQNERFENPKQGRGIKYIYKGMTCIFSIEELKERDIDCDKNFRIGDFYFHPIEKLIKCRVLEREIATEVPDNERLCGEAFEKGRVL